MFVPCFHRVRQGGKAGLASVLAMGLWTLGTSRRDGTNTTLTFTGELEVGEVDANKPRCTVEDLLPRSSPHKSLQWTDENIAESRYDCTCAATKARYYCPSADINSGHPMWVPRAVVEEKCESITHSELAGAPLPPNFKVLMYGNSHLRQVNEATMCMFQKALASKRVTLVAPTIVDVVPGDFQCRACYNRKHPESTKQGGRGVREAGCMTEDDTCKCSDDESEFYFENGAVVHYTFAHMQNNKNIDDARYAHGNETLSYYDAVVVNPGNGPRMKHARVLEMAHELKAVGVPLFYLSTYDGVGDLTLWSKENRESFLASGAHFVPIGDMVRGLEAWTKGSVEETYDDDHYCLPGPPDEIALLLLKLLWAAYEETK